MNWQHCSNVIFLGLGDSYEQYYQAIRRTWRYGQQNPVDVHVITSDIETNVVENIRRKKDQAELMASEVIRYIGDIERENIMSDKKAEIIPESNERADDELGRWTIFDENRESSIEHRVEQTNPISSCVCRIAYVVF